MKSKVGGIITMNQIHVEFSNVFQNVIIEKSYNVNYT